MHRELAQEVGRGFQVGEISAKSQRMKGSRNWKEDPARWVREYVGVWGRNSERWESRRAGKLC